MYVTFQLGSIHKLRDVLSLSGIISGNVLALKMRNHVKSYHFSSRSYDFDGSFEKKEIKVRYIIYRRSLMQKKLLLSFAQSYKKLFYCHC